MDDVKVVTISPQKYADPAIDYYNKVSEFALKVGLYMSCSNGVFKLGPTPQSVQHYSESEAHKKQVEQFKVDNPEYANMKGCKHKEPTSVIYGLHLGPQAGNTIKNTLRQRQLERNLYNETAYSVENLVFLEHMFRNKYRFLEEGKLIEKYPESERLQYIMTELGLLDKKYRSLKKKKTKIFLKLTEEGKKYVIRNRNTAFPSGTAKQTNGGIA